MVDWVKVMFGENAVHVPFNFVRQEAGSDKGLILGQETGVKLAFGSKLSHVMVKGDMIFRPHLVIESEHPQGMGVSAIITSSTFSDLQEWVDRGNILFNLRGKP